MSWGISLTRVELDISDLNGSAACEWMVCKGPVKGLHEGGALANRDSASPQIFGMPSSSTDLILRLRLGIRDTGVAASLPGDTLRAAVVSGVARWL